VVVGRDPLVEAGQHVGDAGRAFLGAQHERVHAPQGHLGHHAERAEPDPGRVEHVVAGSTVDDRAGAVDEGQAGDERGQAAQPAAGAVGTGRGGARDRLHVDVAEVRQRQPVPGEQPVEHRQIGTGADRDQLPFQVDRADSGQPVQAQPGTVGDRGGGERVPGADRLDRPPVRPRLLDRLGDLLDRSRAQFSGAVPLVSGPVGPFVSDHELLSRVSRQAERRYVGRLRSLL